MELGRVRNFIRRHHPRAEGAGVCKGLARHELGGVLLPVTHRTVIVAGITGHVVERILFGNAPAFLADDDGQLAFIIELVGFERLDERCAVTDLAAGIAGKKDRVRRHRAAGFFHVGVIVQAHADDLVRVRNGRCKGDGVKGVISGFARESGSLRLKTGSQKIAQRGAFGETAGKIDNAVVRDEAVAGLSADEEGREFHAEIFS